LNLFSFRWLGLVALLALPNFVHAQAAAQRTDSVLTQALVNRDSNEARLFALGPVLKEVGEARTRQWLAAVSRQCESGKAKTVEGLCGNLPLLGENAAWEDMKRILDQTHALKCSARGLMTAYFEPVLRGSLLRDNDQQVALYAFPEGAARANQAKQTWLSRGEIENLASDGSSELITRLAPGLTPIAWIDDPVEAFFLHIQGSGRIQLRDQPASPLLRVGFAGHNGHTYRAIGASLVALGEMQRSDVSANSIKAWLNQRLQGSKADRLKALEVMHSNPRYVFFKRMPDSPNSASHATRGPLGALAVPLTDMASVAADPVHHPLGASLFIYTDRLGAQLVQVQDVGGGIKGPGRLDLFTGTGDAAGHLASDFKEPLRALELVAADRKDDVQPRLQLEMATALANCSGGM
jgi:membrane-bound lytic murein transglycosylase A